MVLDSTQWLFSVTEDRMLPIMISDGEQRADGTVKVLNNNEVQRTGSSDYFCLIVTKLIIM